MTQTAREEQEKTRATRIFEDPRAMAVFADGSWDSMPKISRENILEEFPRKGMEPKNFECPEKGRLFPGFSLPEADISLRDQNIGNLFDEFLAVHIL